MGQTDREYCEWYCHTIAEEMKDLSNAIDPNNDEEYEEALKALDFTHIDKGDEIITWLNETCLEIINYYDMGGDPTGYVILRTVGGPRCEIRREIEDGEAFYIDTWSGGDYHSHRFHSRALAFNLDELLTN